MARQNNVLQLTGGMQDLVHFRKNGKYFTRSKPIVLQQTENTKKASAEFGRASIAASRLSKAFQPLLEITPHPNHFNRLTSAFTKMIDTSPIKQKGNRTILQGNPTILNGFQFNPATSIKQLLPGVCPKVRVVNGDCIQFELPSFSPGKVCREKQTANGIRIEIICFVSDGMFDMGSVYRFEELDLALDCKCFEGGSVQIPLAGTNNKLVFWGMSVHYLDKTMMPYHHHNYTAFDIIDALLIKNGERVPFKNKPGPFHTKKIDQPPRSPWEFKKSD